MLTERVSTPRVSWFFPDMASVSYCLLVPHFNHAREFCDFLPRLVATELPIVIVDDGSDDENLSTVSALVNKKSNIYLFAHEKNRGKGAAVKTGFVHARALGFTHAIQIDADGQHCVEDIPVFVGRSRVKPNVIICGQPIFDESASKVRRYGRQLTNFWIVLETLSFQIKDGLSGFRLYPLLEAEQLVDNYFLGPKMDFDPAILVFAIWHQITVEFVQTRVVYNEEGVSHFSYVGDNIVFISLHARLMLGMLFRSPKLLWRKFRKILTFGSA
jgi:polyprenyl-phospho-N-acetylgalactosaminyl synthase